MTSDISHGPAVHSVDEFVFAVPDLAQAQHFCAAFGLDVRQEGAALALWGPNLPADFITNVELPGA